MIGIDMEMPNSCGECPFVFNKDGYFVTCNVANINVEDYYFESNPNCPLIEIEDKEKIDVD